MARHKGRPLSKEHKQKISEAMMGRKPSEEAKRKQSISQRGENNSNWRGGLRFNQGHIPEVHMPWHPHADNWGYVKESRVFAEEALGRYLSRNEVVHHIDGDSFNNSKSNLLICTRSYHSWLHCKIRRNKWTLIPGLVIFAGPITPIKLAVS